MPTICRCRPAPARPCASARPIRTPTSSASTRPPRWRTDGVWAVITGEDVRKLSDPFLVALKTPVHQWSLAVDRVRYVGEPVALVVAESRYLAEDAAELVEIEYAPLEAVIDPLAACKPSAPLLHPEAKTNEISVRKFNYGDTKSAFEQADKRVALTAELPPAVVHADGMLRRRRRAQSGRRQLRRAGELPGAVQHPSGDGARAARARAEDAAAHPARIPAAASASSSRCFPMSCWRRSPRKITGRPVKWVEDRVEHLVAASSGPNRVTEIEAAVTKDGRILGAADRPARGLRRVPARADARPALPHARRGDRRLRHCECRRDQPRRAHQQDAGEPHSRLRRPAALSWRWSGWCSGSRSSLASIISRSSGAISFRRDKFPYRAAAGSLYDSGDYLRAVETAVGERPAR